MAEAEGHANHQFPRVSDEAGYCSSFIPVHTRARRIPPGDVRRFLRLRAQAPTVPNEIVIEAMIKGLRPGPAAQILRQEAPLDPREVAPKDG
jgi:hypothetical protein